MEDVKVVDGKVESQIVALRVDSVEKLQHLLPFLAMKPNVQTYCRRHITDPLTLILTNGAKSCLIASILEHDFFGRICIYVWAQNADQMDIRHLRYYLQMAEDWAKTKGAEKIVAFVDDEGPWKRLPAYLRLTGLNPYRMVFAKETI
jgi:hypothetical protein